jgi:RNA polymerase sigma-70 factor (ECF subfamily)
MSAAPARENHAELVSRVANARDRSAFAVLFDHYAPRLNGYMRRLGLDARQAEEITQEVMIVLWHKAALFDAGKSSLATWLFRIARNRRIDAMRRDRSHLLDPLDPIFQPDEPEPAEAVIDARQREERIRLALAELPEDQMTLIRYAFFLGLTHSQIAARAGLPLGTVKSRIRLAFARLRRTLEADPKVDVDV